MIHIELVAIYLIDAVAMHIRIRFLREASVCSTDSAIGSKLPIIGGDVRASLVVLKACS